MGALQRNWRCPRCARDACRITYCSRRCLHTPLTTQSVVLRQMHGRGCIWHQLCCCCCIGGFTDDLLAEHIFPQLPWPDRQVEDAEKQSCVALIPMGPLLPCFTRPCPSAMRRAHLAGVCRWWRDVATVSHAPTGWRSVRLQIRELPASTLASLMRWCRAQAPHICSLQLDTTIDVGDIHP